MTCYGEEIFATPPHDLAYLWHFLGLGALGALLPTPSGRPIAMISAVEVLLIEDDELDRQIVLEVLALRGRGRAHVTEARTFHEGLEQLHTRRFELVLLDTKLPEISALSALRSVGEVAPDTPILPHTPFITTQLRQAARLRGPFDVAVRGDLNPLWTAVSNLLALDNGQRRIA